MSHSYDVRYEKDNYGEKPNYTISVETSNFSCYSELKDLVTTTVAQYELKESAAEDNKSE